MRMCIYIYIRIQQNRNNNSTCCGTSSSLMPWRLLHALEELLALTFSSEARGLRFQDSGQGFGEIVQNRSFEPCVTFQGMFIA